MKPIFFMVLLTTVTVGCKPLPNQPIPATIVQSTAASRAELAEVITNALSGLAVTLANDALTKDSVLIIERARPRGTDGVHALGRNLQEPLHFELLIERDNCILRLRSSGETWRLSHTKCSPIIGTTP